MAYQYTEANVVNLKHMKMLAERTQGEIANLAGLVAGAIEESMAYKADGNLRIFYGTCTTAASTQTKAVTISGLSDLQDGDIFGVLMTNAQSYNGTPKLKINALDAINIRRIDSKNAARYEWAAGQMVIFTYTGSYFVIAGGGVATTTYYGKTRLCTAVDSNSESLAATPKAVKLAYDLAAGKATVHRFDVTIPISGWSNADGLYSITLSVPGMLATDQGGNVGPVQSGTESSDSTIRKAWNKITRISAGADSITVYSTVVPSVAINIQLEVLR